MSWKDVDGTEAGAMGNFWGPQSISSDGLTLIAKSSKHENAKQPHWGAGEKLVLGHLLAATIGDSARCMQNLEKVLFTGPKTSDTVTFICD